MEKLGLGSSAAITVALTAALLSQRGAATSTLLELAVAAHRRFQGGAGSGIDVAAAVQGGVVVLDAAGPLAPRRLAWPAQLHWLAVWTGQGASTTAMLSRLAEFRQREPAQSARCMAGLRAAAIAALAAWERGVAGEVLTALAAYRDCLAELDAESGIGIITPAHRELAAHAAASGAVYKTSGAGGGDFGLAFATSPELIVRLANDYADRGALTLAGRADVPGVRLVG
jgi:mevalonate kinase